MQRKVNKIGPSTLMVSLPSKWVKKYNVKKGDVLEVEEQEDNILLHNPKKIREGTTLSLDLDELNVSLIWYSLTAAYRSGVDEMRLKFSEETVRDDKLDKKVEIHELLQTIIDRCIGMEIIRNTPSTYVIKEISSIKEEEFNVIFRRIFFSLQVMLDDIIQGMEAKDKKIINHVAQYADIQVNKFCDYCIRILTKTNTGTPMLTSIIFRLEAIGDSLKHLALHLLKKDLGDEVLDFLKDGKLFLSAMEKFYFTEAKQDLLSLEKRKVQMRKKAEVLQNQTDVATFILLRNVIQQIRSVMEIKLTLNFLQTMAKTSSSLRQES